jgi:hypothetical protein
VNEIDRGKPYRWITSIKSLSFCTATISVSLTKCPRQVQLRRDKMRNSNSHCRYSGSDNSTYTHTSAAN